jgi:hypothetical protein
MRVLTVAMIMLMSSALVPAFAEEAKSPSQPQATPVQPERSTQQSRNPKNKTGSLPRMSKSVGIGKRRGLLATLPVNQIRKATRQRPVRAVSATSPEKPEA